jgi:2,3-bisphosphoglycerate-dependent phosphoglycerate mutase
MHLDKLTKEQVLELNIPTGAPLLYVFDSNGTIVEKKYL